MVYVPPDAGDSIQAMKAGITEIADIFAVNKSDMVAAANTATDIKRIVSLTQSKDAGAWVPPVVLTSHYRPESIVELSAQVDRHTEWLDASGGQAERTLARHRYRLLRWFERMARTVVDAEPAAFYDLPLDKQIAGLLRRIGAR